MSCAQGVRIGHARADAVLAQSCTTGGGCRRARGFCRSSHCSFPARGACAACCQSVPPAAGRRVALRFSHAAPAALPPRSAAARRASAPPRPTAAAAMSPRRAAAAAAVTRGSGAERQCRRRFPISAARPLLRRLCRCRGVPRHMPRHVAACAAVRAVRRRRRRRWRRRLHRGAAQAAMKTGMQTSKGPGAGGTRLAAPRHAGCSWGRARRAAVKRVLCRGAAQGCITSAEGGAPAPARRRRRHRGSLLRSRCFLAERRGGAQRRRHLRKQ